MLFPRLQAASHAVMNQPFKICNIATHKEEPLIVYARSPLTPQLGLTGELSDLYTQITNVELTEAGRESLG